MTTDTFSEPSEPFDETQLTDDPIELFRAWYEAATDQAPGDWYLSNAMTLATSDLSGYVTARTVLMKGILPDGLLFFTNYDSQKAQQLLDNPRAAVVFHWPHLFRQVRFEGSVLKTNKEVSEAYFYSRPRGSQISALTSAQSSVVESRQVLEEQHLEIEANYRSEPIPFPDNWGGFALVAERIEFWHSQQNRLHDRFRYQRTGAQWTTDRLAP